jgi:2-polyprenyl-6-methoxyphenol hydroxylase-like FAD-dependent oxidoreductase
MRIAVNGCGIAGPTLAWWLRRYGHEPVLFEQADRLREGGYIIDFWGSGYDVAERMGLFPGLMDDAYIMERLRTVTSGNRTTSSLNARTFQDLTNGRYISIARSDLSRHIFQASQGIEARFGTSIEGVEERQEDILVSTGKGEAEAFDLVIGADGLHSGIRSVVFGPQERYERPLGLHVAAFTLSGYRPREELTYVSFTQPGRQISRVALRGDRTLFLFVFDSSFMASEPANEQARKDVLKEIFGGMGWEADAILERIGEVDDLYFDRVSQIRMFEWTKGRVALIGDAAACASLLAGEGTGFAMTEAYVLAGELHRAGGDHAAAFRRYEERMRDYISGKQDAARKFAGFFAPRNWARLILRDVLTNAANIPGLSRYILGQGLLSEIELPDYGGAG